MGCACKVNQEIDKIQKYYSINSKKFLDFKNAVSKFACKPAASKE